MTMIKISYRSQLMEMRKSKELFHPLHLQERLKQEEEDHKKKEEEEKRARVLAYKEKKRQEKQVTTFSFSAA